MSSGCVGDGLGSSNETAGRPAPASGGCAASTATGNATGTAVAEPPTCCVIDESTGATFEFRPGQLLLDAALAEGIDLAHGCRNGVCGACAVEVIEGLENAERPDAIEANSLQRFRLPRNARLACRMRLNGSAKIRPA